MRRRVLLVAAAALLMGVCVGASKAVAKMSKGTTPRWHGRIVRVNKDDMTLDVRKGTVEKRIHFDSSTQFVKPKTSKTTEPIDMSTLKEGDDVICIGTTDEKGDFHATQVQLQPGK